MNNVEAVKDVYAAYSRGDMQSILARLSEAVDWENCGGATDVPWLAARAGHSGVVRFFETLTLLQVHEFRAKAFLEADHEVVVLVDEDITVKATGRRLREHAQVHLWSFDEHGKIIRHRQRVDTHMHWIAFHAGTT